MSINSKASQGGAIKTYVIIGVVLITALLLGLYFVQQRGEQARKEQAIAQAEDINKDNSNPPITEEEPVVVEGGQDNSDEERQPAPRTEEPATIPQTGADDLTSLLMTGAYTGLIVAFIASRRATR